LAYLPASLPSSVLLTTLPTCLDLRVRNVTWDTATQEQDGSFNINNELCKILQIEQIHFEQRKDGKRKRANEDGAEEHENMVVIKWKGQLVPFCFQSLRRAIELVSFACWRRRDMIDESELGWNEMLLMLLDEWHSYRRRLDDELRERLPAWQASQILALPVASISVSPSSPCSAAKNTLYLLFFLQ